jgi:hypothetical protein
MSGSPEQGWYESPDNADMLRWWDGSEWTDKEKPKPSVSKSKAAPPKGSPVEKLPKSKISPEKVTNTLGGAGLAAAGVALAADGAFGLGKTRKGFSGLGKFFIIGFSLTLVSIFGVFIGLVDAFDGINRSTTMGTVTKIQTDDYDRCIPTAEFTVNGETVVAKGTEFETCTWEVGDPIKVSFDENTNGTNPAVGEPITPIQTIGGSVLLFVVGLFVAIIGFVKLAVRAGSVAGGFLLVRQGLKLGSKNTQ